MCPATRARTEECLDSGGDAGPEHDLACMRLGAGESFMGSMKICVDGLAERFRDHNAVTFHHIATVKVEVLTTDPVGVTSHTASAGHLKWPGMRTAIGLLQYFALFSGLLSWLVSLDTMLEYALSTCLL